MALIQFIDTAGNWVTVSATNPLPITIVSGVNGINLTATSSPQSVFTDNQLLNKTVLVVVINGTTTLDFTKTFSSDTLTLTDSVSSGTVLTIIFA